MRITSQEISVESSILKWARETIGKSIEEVARRLDISESVVERWESGEKRPTLKQLRELSKFYKRPLAAFFLSAPPAEAPTPTDFRTLPKTSKKPFSEKTLLAMRRARRLQALANELSKTLDREYRLEVGQAALSDNLQWLASQVRERLGVTIEEQLNWKNEAAALTEWRRRVEEGGVLIFEQPFPFEEGRAFSFAEAERPVIVLNSNDPATNGRIFSLFHEYAHLLLRQSGSTGTGMRKGSTSSRSARSRGEGGAFRPDSVSGRMAFRSPRLSWNPHARRRSRTGMFQIICP
ncbi:MAG: hypothetical protein A2Z25_23305 [Planctomycetes bacterium RBG_16_55_9]|nr:MAG: hypothetical protein A2Z25_23305 [Planctomycetes bacterium RBG_16_55_9]